MSDAMQTIARVTHPSNVSPYAGVRAVIFDQVCEELGFNPTKYAATPVTITSPAKKRDRHKAGKVTQKVWDSLLPDGTVDPQKAVPIGAVNTQELPTIGGDEAE